MNHRAYRPYSGKRKKGSFLRIVLALFLVGVLCFGILTGIIAGYNRDRIQGDPGIMIILGCKVQPWGEPSILLQDRLDKAAEYLAEHPDMTVIVSGGQGSDEPDTEANIMKNVLVEKGVKEENILLEDNSFSTWENLLNSIDVLAAAGHDVTQDILVVSNGFHLARVHMLWGRLTGGQDNLSVLAAPSSHVPSRWKMHFREPVGLVKSFLFDR